MAKDTKWPEKRTYNTYKERERKRGGGAKEQADTGETMTRTSIDAYENHRKQTCETTVVFR